jgi:C1A family cysteine protease
LLAGIGPDLLCSRRTGPAPSPNHRTRTHATAPSESPARCPCTASPDRWDSRDPAYTGGVSRVSRIKDQGQCGSCVAFTLVATAETTAATVLGRPGSDFDFSEQLYVGCTSDHVWCEVGWTLPSAGSVITSTGVQTETCTPYTGQDGSCPRTGSGCGAVPSGTWSTRQINSIAEIQEHVRTYGAALAAFDV